MSNYNHYAINWIPRIYYTRGGVLYKPSFPHVPVSRSWQPQFYFLFLSSVFWIPHIHDVIYCSSLSDLFQFFNALRVVSDGRISFIFLTEYYFIVYTVYITFSLFSSISGLLGCFHLVYLMLQWTWGCKYLFKNNDFISFRCIPWRRIARSCDNSVFNFFEEAAILFP